MREPTPNEKNNFLVSDVESDSGFPMHKKKKYSKTNMFYWLFSVFEKNFSTFFQNLYSNHVSLLSVGAERGRYRFSLYVERGVKI